jgi:transposase
VLGVDDWAWKKGQRYGTILVDLERRCPVDLLPDRCAGSFEKWLARNPGIEVIARARASLYAQGATAGAPAAVQVADRFHLLCNLTAAVERALQQKKLIAPSDTDAIPSEVESASTEPRPDRLDIRKQERRTGRLERYTEVARLYQEEHSQRAISRITGLQRKTVRRFLRAGEFPQRATPKRKPSRLDRFRPYLETRWKEGCHNATKLWREIQRDGYTGARGMVANLVTSFRAPGTKYFRKVAEPKKTDMKRLLSSPRQLAYLLGREQVNCRPKTTTPCSGLPQLTPMWLFCENLRRRSRPCCVNVMLPAFMDGSAGHSPRRSRLSHPSSPASSETSLPFRKPFHLHGAAGRWKGKSTG